MRSAISPRLAMRTLRNIRPRPAWRASAAGTVRRRGDGAELDHEKALAIFDRVARLDEARPDDAIDRCHDFLGDSQHVDRPEAITGPDPGTGRDLGPRLEDPDGGRRRHVPGIGPDRDQ